jgi:transposase
MGNEPRAVLAEGRAGTVAAQQVSRPRARVQTIDRQQGWLRSVVVEELVEEDHSVRAIWELTGQLDLSGYYEAIRAVEGVAGAEAIDPRLLVSLWLLAYSQGMGSAREIERRCSYHPAYQWLTGMRVINHHTLSDFRVRHGPALEELFIEVLGVLSSEDLVDLKRVMHDGMRVKAWAGTNSFGREARLRKHLEAAREQVVEMSQWAHDDDISPRQVAARQRAAREKQQRLERACEELKKIQAVKRGNQDKQQARASRSDPQARIMKQSDGGYAPSYNAQISTDAKACILVAAEVSQSGSDYEELVPAERRIEDTCGQPPVELVADGGFTSRANIIEMEQRGVNFIGSMGDGQAQSAGQLKRRGVALEFRTEAFVYDSEHNTYTCPQGQILKYESQEKRIGIIHYHYRASAAACQACPLKSRCCPQQGAQGRSLVRGVEDPVVVAFRQKMETEAAQQAYKQRGAVAEFPNAWIKDKLRLRQFRLRGLAKVRMELLWACLTYNVQQWIRLCWRPRLAMAQGGAPLH